MFHPSCRRRKVLLGLLTGMAALVAGCNDDSSLSDADAGPTRGGKPCALGETACVEGRLRTCLEDETGWLVEACPASAICQDGACVEQACAPGGRDCAEGGVRTCAADGQSWSAPVACAEDRTCTEGVCLARTCTPGETACADKVVLTCAEDGLRWDRTPCSGAERCLDGTCRDLDLPPASCPPGATLCAPTAVVACGEDGETWVETPCAEGEACFDGRCVGCVRDADCPEGSACVGDACGPPPLRILTTELPPAQIDQPYMVVAEAENGTTPYAWALVDGAPPAGLELTATGALTGTPTEAGAFDLQVQVTDADAATDSAAWTLTVLPPGLQIVTESLPPGEEGEVYAAQLEAVGGTTPYGWLIVDGVLPAGLVLGANGSISGTPTEVGQFPLRIRAVDASDPPLAAERDLRIDIAVSPLRIIGDQRIDLLITQIVVLPTITVVQNLPIPYETQLMARGGLRPHHWTEVPLDQNLARLLPNSGLPEGLTLEDDGRLHGAVTDTNLIIRVPIPFTMIELTGFFFTAEVYDSQGVPDRASAIFLLPTLPIGG